MTRRARPYRLCKGSIPGGVPSRVTADFKTVSDSESSPIFRKIFPLEVIPLALFRISAVNSAVKFTLILYFLCIFVVIHCNTQRVNGSICLSVGIHACSMPLWRDQLNKFISGIQIRIKKYTGSVIL